MLTTGQGSKLFYSNGTQFFIKGVAYQQNAGGGGNVTGSSYIDPLSDATICSRDVPLLQKLGTNVIRTYAIDPTKDHSQCMAMLQSAGIYVISDLSEPNTSINRDQPAWNTPLYSRYTSVVDELLKYDNVIGFFAGNEVTNQKNNTQASAYVKAAVRDIKAYVKTKTNRWVGVGYAANDDSDIRADLFQYMASRFRAYERRVTRRSAPEGHGLDKRLTSCIELWRSELIDRFSWI